jgi:type I restriction enzyme S subunit
MDTKLLRQKILDLAIHGKLVPQDPNDEPASVLLENIKVEKEHLIKKGVIKSNIKSSISDNSIKLKAPFQIPISWKWCIISDIAYVASGSTPAKDAFVDSGIPYIKMYNLRDQKIDFEYKPQYIKSEVHNGQLKRSRTKIGDLIMNIVGPPLGKLAIIPKSLPECNFNQAAVLIRPLLHKDIISKYLFYYLSEMSEINSIITRGTAGQVNISLTQSQNMRVAIPPLEEMGKIVNKLDVFFNAIDKLEKNQKELKSIVIQLKSKILNIAMLGKLVPQDPNDEPASELLKRFNPKAKITSATSHYEQLPKGWTCCTLEEVLDYEQPQAYIVTSTNYQNNYSIPVLTAGKSFIIGYTKENYGVCNNLPVIIFDDFTTESKYVDFPFKVKSSAMKILHAKTGLNTKFIQLIMTNIKFKNETHKRYWISEYSKMAIALPPIKEQERIVNAIDKIQEQLNKIYSIL